MPPWSRTVAEPDVSVSTASPSAQRVLARADELATHSSRSDGIERVYLSPEHRAVNDLAAGWMREAGLVSWEDAAGNQCGRHAGATGELPAVLLGSHLDTVPGAGRYDGILGVLVAIEVAERLREVDLPFALEVVAFGDEEGTRFGTTLLGSRALAGTWQPEWFELVDAAGIRLADAATSFGLEPERFTDAARTSEELLAYLEVHIEQGTKLEAADRALGIVTTIAAAERRVITFTGEARHCATPWELRHDALVGASEGVLAIERIARARGSFATVGRIQVQPDAVNVIPGVATFSLDLRDETATGRDATWDAIRDEMQSIAADRRLDFSTSSTHLAPEVVCAPELRAAFSAGIGASGGTVDVEPMELFSVAGHDAMAVAAIAPVGMLFVRCRGGISHHADEAVRADDVGMAIDALETAVLQLAAEYEPR
jgi:allantoate deiminase